MSTTGPLCRSCRRITHSSSRLTTTIQHQNSSYTPKLTTQPYSSLTSAITFKTRSTTNETTIDVASLLSKPTWSVRSLLHSDSDSSSSSSSPHPQPNQEASTTSTSTTKNNQDPTTITPTQLSHLLRLSALPPPTTPSASASMLATLHSQLLFVREIQKVDTTAVEPLRSIRDETAAGLAEVAISVDTLRDALAAEDVVGHCKRPRRRRHEQPVGASEVENWDVLGTASEKVGRYFVVRSGKGTNSVAKESGVAAMGE